MNVNKLLVDTLTPFVKSKDEVSQDIYIGKEEKYITFNYEDERVVQSGDDMPDIEGVWMQVHYFSPLKLSTGDLTINQIKKQIRSALFNAGFSYAQITSLFDAETKKNHIVFSCSIAGKTDYESEE